LKKQKTIDYEPLTDWSNEPSYSALSRDVTEMSGIQEKIREDLRKYKLAKEGGKKLPDEEGKSSMRPLVVRKQQEWKYATLEEPLMNSRRLFDISPRTFEDELSAKQNSVLLNYQYEVLIDKSKLIGDIVRPFVDEGTVIVKTGWETGYRKVIRQVEKPVYASPEESLAFIQKAVVEGRLSPQDGEKLIAEGKGVPVGSEMVDEEVEVLVKNQPTHEVLDNANVGIDPTCEGDLSKAQFVWHEYETSYAELIKDKYDAESGRGFYRNIDKAIAAGDESLNVDNSTDKYLDRFLFDDKARKKVKAVEYWGYWDIENNGVLVPIVAVWVNSVMIRLEENPFAHKRLPFSMAQYMPVTRSTRGEPDAKLIDANQEAIGKLSRAAHDIASTAAVGQEFIDESLFVSQADKNQYLKGKTVFVNSGMDPRRAIYRRSVDPIDPAVFNMISTNVNEVETLTGVKPFAGGTGAGGLGLAKISLDATAKRDLSTLRRLSALLIDMARMVISMNGTNMEEEQVVRVTNKEYVTVKRDDLEGNIDLRISISTPEKDAQQAQELGMLLQTNAASMPPKLYNTVLAKIMDLQYHPEEAEMIRSYEPAPDPAQEEMKKLELEKAREEVEGARLKNELIKAEMTSIHSVVQERATRSTENMNADIQNKLAQAELRAAQAELALAQAELAKSQSDKVDQEVVDVHTGAAEERDYAKRMHESEIRNQERENKLFSEVALKEETSLKGGA